MTADPLCFDGNGDGKDDISGESCGGSGGGGYEVGLHHPDIIGVVVAVEDAGDYVCILSQTEDGNYHWKCVRKDKGPDDAVDAEGDDTGNEVTQCELVNAADSAWDAIRDGTYVGTGFGQDALDYYASVIANPESSTAARTGAYAGGFLAALWTPQTYVKTTLTLATAGAVSEVLAARGLATSVRIGIHSHAGGPHAYPHVQINLWLHGVKESGKAFRIRCWR